MNTLRYNKQEPQPHRKEWKHLDALDNIFKKSNVCEPLATASSSSGLQTNGELQQNLDDVETTARKTQKKRKADDLFEEYVKHRIENDRERTEQLRRLNDILERLLPRGGN